MSVVHSVFLIANRLPTTAELNRALSASGIELQLDLEWNTRTDSGFWPATFQRQEAGFEWLVERVADADLEKPVAKRAAPFDLVVSLVTHSGENELASALATWGVLVSLTKGLGYSEESGDFIGPDEALTIAKEQSAVAPRAAEPVVNYPRVLDTPLPVTETRRTSISLALTDSQHHFMLFFDTRKLPSHATHVILRRVEDRRGEFTVLELKVNEQTIHFTSEGGVLEPAYVPDYAALATRLGDTESVALALRKGGVASATALAGFIQGNGNDVAQRQLAIITLGLMNGAASVALSALRPLVSHQQLGAHATTAITRIEKAVTTAR